MTRKAIVLLIVGALVANLAFRVDPVLGIIIAYPTGVLVGRITLRDELVPIFDELLALLDDYKKLLR